jgi:pyrophosphatase PpaX
MNLDCFIFDFDGTLARSQPAYNAAFSHSVRLHTGIEISEEEFLNHWYVSPQEFLGRYGTEKVEVMMASFEEHYYANHHHHLTAYDGIVELLELIHSAGGAVAVVSLKPRRAGELELDLTRLRPFIHFSVWGDDVERVKPQPDAALLALNMLAAQPARAIVIGDSPSDIRMGHAAGTRTAAALWSDSSTEKLLAESPDFSFHSPSELQEFLSNVFTNLPRHPF